MITQLDRRKIEAAVLAEMYETLTREFDRDTALEMVAATTRRAAHKAGRGFAAQAPRGPGLKHFAAILDVWRAGAALDIEGVRLQERRLEFRVVRCGYVQAYRDMGLPEDLIYNLSCERDGSLAAGYSPRLALERPQTISRGAPDCLFIFHWSEG